MILRALLRPWCWLWGHDTASVGMCEHIDGGLFASHTSSRCMRCGKRTSSVGLSDISEYTERDFFDLLTGRGAQ
jgi:heterodisulfide reductase subunit C